MESLITRFTEDDPCWTEPMLTAAGEEISFLSALVSQGALEEEGGVYFLTKAGAALFEEAAASLFIMETPGVPSSSPAKDVFRTKLRFLLDNAHVQRWGVKRFIPRARLPYLPSLSSALFSLEGGALRWLYTDDSIYQAMKATFPTVTIDARRTDLTTQNQIDAWAEAQGARFGTLDADLLYLCDYDFMQYKNFPGHPNDPMRLINADRFLFSAAGQTIEEHLAKIGEFHLWLNYLRRMQIPGYVDRDTQEQDSVSWLLFASETEEEAKRTANALVPFGEALLGDANPCEIWSISLEALEDVKEKRELVWELLPDVAHAIQRAKM